MLYTNPLRRERFCLDKGKRLCFMFGHKGKVMLGQMESKGKGTKLMNKELKAFSQHWNLVISRNCLPEMFHGNTLLKHWARNKLLGEMNS